MQPILIFVLTILTYAQTFSYEFLYDDEFLVQKNMFLRSWDYLFPLISNSSTAGFGGSDSFFRPLQGFSYLVLFQIFGEHPEPFRVFNVLLHGCNALLVWKLLKSIFDQKNDLPFWLALIWALHPLHIEAITYISGTADPLFSFFSLVAANVFMSKITETKKIFFVLVTTVLALASKETAVVTPALLTACFFIKNWDLQAQLKSKGDRFFTSFSQAWALSLQSLRRLWSVWILVAGYLLLRATVFDFENTFAFYEKDHILTQSLTARFFTFLTTLPKYLELFLWPHRLHIDRDFPITTEFFNTNVILGLLLFLALISPLVLNFKRNHNVLVFASLWFFASHVPHMGILLPVNALILDHWMYLPSLSLIVILGVLIKNQSRFFLRVFFPLVTSYFLVFNHLNQQPWSSALTFYQHILDQGSRSLRVMNNFAMALSEADRSEEALSWYRLALSGGGEKYPQIHHNIARIYLEKKDYLSAISAAKSALSLNPNFFQSAFLLAEIYHSMGDQKKSLEWKIQAEKILETTRRTQGL